MSGEERGPVNGRRRKNHDDARIQAEKERSAETEAAIYLCDGPDWPPETTTCGRMLTHPGRCKECSAIRTRLRKSDRRHERRTAAAREKEPASYELALPTFR